MVAAKYPSQFFNNISTRIHDHHHIPRIEIQKDFCPTLKTLPKIQDHLHLSSKIEELQNHILVFNLEETLLKSSSWFPFFMLVAFEGGGLIRALLLFLLYPIICMLDEEWKLKIMVFVSFFGIKRGNFRIGRTVLPKFFLEDVGYEGFELIKRFGKKVAVTNLPRVMVEGFLKDYLGIQIVIGREIKATTSTNEGYYLGLMDDNLEVIFKESVGQLFVLEQQNITSQLIGVVGSSNTINKGIFTNCEETYLVSEDDKKRWQYLPREKYPKPLIFHDGRLAFLPTPLASLSMFMWLPFGILLCIIRIIVSQFLPYHISIPILAFLGTSGLVSTNHDDNHDHNNPIKGTNLYVCNHKTLLDPVYISFACGVPLTALTYSISKTSQMISPIKTITLTRDRQKDARIMCKMLRKGSIVVCPEGTTCREPYLLRFSPLFAEISSDIVPVGLEVKVSMFYGTTASGIKALDPIIFLLNPYPFYYIKFLEKLPKSHTCSVSGGMSKFDVANYVQDQIAKALDYKCTSFTRKDKYLVLAGNTGESS